MPQLSIQINPSDLPGLKSWKRELIRVLRVVEYAITSHESEQVERAELYAVPESGQATPPAISDTDQLVRGLIDGITERRFTSSQIYNNPLTNGRPRGEVRGALNRAVEAGLIVAFAHGKGRKPTIYEKV